MLHTNSHNAIQSPTAHLHAGKWTLSYRKAQIFCAMVALILFLAIAGAASANTILVTNEDEEVVTWNLSAEKVSYLSNSQILEAEGRVILRQGEDYLKADFVRYFQATQWILLRGNVEVKLNEDLLDANEAEFDLRNRVGWLKEGRVFIDGPHMYFTGERVDKHWGDHYTFRNAKITACDGDVPAWSVSAGAATIELDGYATLEGTKFQVSDNDVAYVPYFILPAKSRRQTGFLFPEFGKSTRLGYWYSQPFYWAIDESRDMTFTETWMERRGVNHSVEYRHHDSIHSKGWWRADWLYDSQIVKDEEDENGSFDDDGLIRTNEERFWLRGMYDGTLNDPRWKLKADLDYVSDQNYLREFTQGSGSFEETRDALYDFFGRDLNERDENRTSRVQLSRDWSRVGIAATAIYEQNVEIGNGNRTSATDATIQTAPRFDMFLFKGGVPYVSKDIPLEIEADAHAANFYRNNGTRGSRFDIKPSVSMPLVSRYGTIIPSFSYRATYYGTDTTEPLTANEGDGKGTSRFIPTMNVTAFSEAARTFRLAADEEFTATNDNTGETRWTMLRHSIQPRLEYTNRPNINQQNNPLYDESDRIEPENELRVSLTNLLTRKRARSEMEDGEEGPVSVLNYDYQDVARLRVEGGYDFREADRNDQLDEYERRPLNDLEAELVITPLKYLDITNRTFWSPYTGDITSHEHSVALFYEDLARLETGLDFRDEIDEYKRQRSERVRIFNMKTSLQLTEPVRMNTVYRSDVESKTDLEKTLELIYTHQCYEIMGRYSRTPGDETYSIWIKLPGLSF